MNSIAADPLSSVKEDDLSQSLFAQIRDFIYEQSGLFFADHKKYLLHNRLTKRAAELGLNSFKEYYYFLRYDPRRNEELAALFDAITTNETYFFRNEPQLEAFKQVAGEMIKRKQESGMSPFRIWSAGCSTGEEPYTLAIMLHELLNGQVQKWNLNILATDISRSVMEAARQGHYAGYATRNLTQEHLEKYFTVIQMGRHKINDEIKRIVLFQHLNLNDIPHSLIRNRYDIIFCRNVTIYFHLDMKKRLVKQFYDALNPGGYLFIGHAESLHGVSDAFKLVHFERAMAYMKES